MEGPHKELVGAARDLTFNDPYQAYEGERIAGLSDQQNAANRNREEIFNRGDTAGQFAADQFTAGSGLTGQMQGIAGSEFGMDEYQKRRNPYFDSVVDKEIREANQSFDRRLNTDQATSVARGGSVGSYRVGLENAFMEQERAQTLGDIRGQGELDAYNQAESAFERDRAFKLQGLKTGADTYSQMGLGASQIGSESLMREQSMANELERSGLQNQEIHQRELDLARSDYYEEKDYDYKQLQFLSGIMSGIPTTPYASQTAQQNTPSSLQQIASAGLTTASIAQMMGWGA
jgi:hypothetical protein